MSEARRLMSADEFLEWCTVQEGRYELVGGEPVAMAGARQAHDRVVMNAAILVGTQTRGGACRPCTGDVAIRIPGGTIRRPDLAIDCGPFEPDALHATDPRVVIEVLSPSTRTFDMVRKLGEYQRLPSLRHILLIDPDEPRVVHWTRDGRGPWVDIVAEGLDSRIVLEDLGIILPLRDLYDGLSFTPRPVSPSSA